MNDIFLVFYIPVCIIWTVVLLILHKQLYKNGFLIRVLFNIFLFIIIITENEFQKLLEKKK